MYVCQTWLHAYVATYVIVDYSITIAIDGGWSGWQNVTNCSNEGVIIQQRSCTQPSPSCGGRNCSGENIAYVACICPGTYV